jgi:drug/metabolite transporter (DMT)-like permease
VILEELAAVTADVPGAISLDPRQFWGIPLALLGAVFLSFGAQYQSRGLRKVERITGKSAGSGISRHHFFGLVRRPSWVVGTILLGTAVLLQIGSLSLSPLIVVQPLGVVALVITAVLNSRMSQLRLGKRAIAAIAMCVAGVVIFVSVASFTASDRPVTNAKLITILILFGVVMLAAMALFVVFRHRAVAVVYIVGAGVLYGFVATFAKAVLGRLTQHEFDWLTWLCVIALAAGAFMGMVFVQNAYSSGPPDLIVAGLTVVDPLVAVFIGIVVLGEAASAPGWAIWVFILSAAIAIIGVFGLAKYHPQADARENLESATL